ncbi:MAG: ABC transporter permease [Bacteroidia bacterium]
MGKIGLIIWREYSTRIRNKTFIVMSILGPVLIAGFFTLIVWLPNADKTEQKVMVVDESYAIRMNKIPDNAFMKFYYPEMKLEAASKSFYETDFTCILYIPYNVISGGGAVQLYYKKSPGFAAENYIKSQLESKFYEFKLASNKIDPAIIKNAREPLKLITSKLDAKGNSVETRNENIMWIGFAGGVLIFMFVIMYGVQVMRSVMEEKTNRIVEVIVSSVKPFQLMMGKIIGVALVGLTQFVLWVILSSALTSVASGIFLKKISADVQNLQSNKEEVYKQGSNTKFNELKKVDSKLGALQMVRDLESVDFTEVIICFMFYFLGGYLLYSSLFAAIGSAVDSEADTQQFMMPVMLPLILGYVMSVNFIQNPEGDLAFWGSMIPFTSPIVMMVRLPFGVPLWQILLSMSFLVMGFLFTTWLAGKIYRTGILMYGKKVSWKELSKWIFYRG